MLYLKTGGCIYNPGEPENLVQEVQNLKQDFLVIAVLNNEWDEEQGSKLNDRAVGGVRLNGNIEFRNHSSKA